MYNKPTLTMDAHHGILSCVGPKKLNCSKQLHMLLLEAPASWSYKPIPFQEKNWLWVENRVELCTSTTGKE